MGMEMRFALLGAAMIFALPSSTASKSVKGLNGPPAEPVPGASRFALKFLQSFQNVANTKLNTVMSPLSAQIALSILLPGAQESTESVMKKGLDVDYRTNEYLASIEEFVKNLEDHVNVHIASTVFFSNTVELLDSYKKSVKHYFNSDLQQVDFKDRKKAVEVINNWCSERTAGLIKDIVSRGDIQPNTRLVIANAIHFKSSWKHTFQESLTKTETFVTTKRLFKKIKVQMMHSGKPWRCRFNNNHEALKAQILELDYKTDPSSKTTFGYKMVIILPKEKNGITETLKKLEGLDLSGIVDSLVWADVIVKLPKFRQEIKTNLNKVLEKMGLGEIFGSPNFKGISNEPLAVGQVLQKAVITVAENGTEAAVATAVTANSYSVFNPHRTTPPPPQVFTADHPFIYFIVLTQYPIPIFQGVVMKPKFK